MKKAVLLVLVFVTAALSCHLTTALDSTSQHEPKAAQGLNTWITANGGQVGIVVGVVNDQGLRGSIAARDFKAGDTLVILPATVTIPLESYMKTSPEHVATLVRHRARHGSEFAPYWASLPPVGKMFVKETFEERHRELLQDAHLVEQTRLNRDWTLQYYNEHLVDIKIANGGRPVTEDEFVHYACLVASYAFTFKLGEEYVRWMLPLLDLMNYAGDGNTEVTQSADGKMFYATANRDIPKGAQVTHRYNSAIHRNDESLLHYGFVQKLSPQPLCAVDMPGWEPNIDVENTFSQEDDHYMPTDRHGRAEEAKRLSGILKSFPTTEAEDAALLQGSSLKDWKERLIVEFRMLRKKALRERVALLNDGLAEL